MPSHNHCCVPMCTNRRVNCPQLSFHKFPAEPDLRKRWIIAVRRDEGPHFRVTKNTLVCSDHFREEDFTLPVGAGECHRARLRPGATPSVFAFGKPCSEAVRATPAERRAIAESRITKMQLPKYGPMTELSSCKADLKAAEERIRQLERSLSSAEAENQLLRRQLFRFCNVKKDSAQMLFFTGLDTEMWTALWTFLNPSPETILSVRSAVKEEEGRSRYPGAGRKPTLSLEDELLLTLMRLCLGRMEKDLAYQFGVSESCISMAQLSFLASGVDSYMVQLGRCGAHHADKFQGSIPNPLCYTRCHRASL